MNVHSSRQNDTRTKILDAALSILSSRGLYDAPMSVIAKTAGVAAGTIYLHFPAKDQLIEALYSVSKESMGKALATGYDATLPYTDQFFGFWDRLYDHFLEHRDEFTFLEHYANSPLIDAKTKEENVRHYKPVTDFLAQGMKEGYLAEADPDWLSALLFGTVTASVRFVMDSGANLEGIRARARLAAWKAAAAEAKEE